MKRKAIIPFTPSKSTRGGIEVESSIKLRKRKKVSLKTLKANAWKWFSKFIRLRDALRTTGTQTHVKCVTCGKLLSISFCDAGHFVSRRHNATLFDEQNVNTQCRYCNRFLHGKLLEYRRQIIQLYGEGKDIEIEGKATEIRKFTAEDLTSLARYYKLKVEGMLNDCN